MGHLPYQAQVPSQVNMDRLAQQLSQGTKELQLSSTLEHMGLKHRPQSMIPQWRQCVQCQCAYPLNPSSSLCRITRYPRFIQLAPHALTQCNLTAWENVCRKSNYRPKDLSETKTRLSIQTFSCFNARGSDFLCPDMPIKCTLRELLFQPKCNA